MGTSKDPIMQEQEYNYIMILSGIYSAGPGICRNSSAVPTLWSGQEQQVEEAKQDWKDEDEVVGHRGVVVPPHTASTMLAPAGTAALQPPQVAGNGVSSFL